MQIKEAAVVENESIPKSHPAPQTKRIEAYLDRQWM